MTSLCKVRTLCMQGAPGRGPRQLFACVQRAKPFKAKAGPVFGCFDLIRHLNTLTDNAQRFVTKFLLLLFSKFRVWLFALRNQVETFISFLNLEC